MGAPPPPPPPVLVGAPPPPPPPAITTSSPTETGLDNILKASEDPTEQYSWTLDDDDSSSTEEISPSKPEEIDEDALLLDSIMQELEALNPGVKIELGPSPDASPPSERQTSLSPQPEKTESTLPVRKRSRASKVERTASIRKSIATLNDADSNELDQLLSELWTIEHGLSDDSAFSTAPVTTAPAPSTVTTQEQGGPVDRQRTDTITHGGKKPVSHDDFSSFMASLAEGGSVVPDFSQFVKEPIYAEPRKVNPPPPPQPEVVPKPLSTEKSHESSPVKQVTPERVPGVPSVEELKNQLDKFVQEVEGDAQLGEEEKAERIKLEKMRIAMQKMKRAQFQQLVVKAVNADGSTKMAVVDEIMTAWDVCKLLVEKNRTQLGPNWTLIERLPSLQIGGLLVDFFFFFLL
jgi:hypothetical protein